MSHPLPLGHRTVTASWTYPGGAIHAAFDYSTKIGTPVFAVKRGHILKVVDTIPNLAADKDGHSGDDPNYILQAIMHRGERVTVVYMHISPDALVKDGDTIHDGQQIALSGHNGHSTGPHLHISVVKGWDNLDNPFHYLHQLTDSSPKPTDGVAANGITIFPPRLVFSGAPVVDLPADKVVMKDLTFGTRSSESVRRLQRRLNKIKLPDSVHLPVSGNYLTQTRAEVQRWQMKKFDRPATSPLADGNLRREQAEILFGAEIKVV